MAATSTECSNEDPLKHVIETVNNLCDEMSKVSGNDPGGQVIDLQLSTAKVLDELNMPSMERAKHESALLTQLDESLSRLVNRSGKVLRSETVERLKRFHDDMQQLVASPPEKSKKRKVKKQKFRKKAALSRLKQTSESSAGNAERTKTPTEEGSRPGHDQDRTDDVIELRSAALRNVKLLFFPENDDSYAIKTPTPGSRRNPPEEIPLNEDSRSVEEVIRKEPDMNMKSRLPSDVSEELVSNQESEDEELPEMASTGQAVVDEGFHSENQAVSPLASRGFTRKLMIGIAIIAAPFVLLWSIVFLLELIHPFHGVTPATYAVIIVWKTVCNVANVICEKFGLLCTHYCASGMKIEKWRRR